MFMLQCYLIFAIFFVDTIFAIQFYKGEQKVQFYAGVAQGLEHLPSKQRVVGLNPISRSSFHQQDGAQQNYLFQTQFYGN